MDVSVVPNVPAERLPDCLDPALVALGLPGLDGSRSACDWQLDATAAQAGIVASAKLPILQRDDFVQNSNDSAWMSNPAAPLTGFSPLVSRDRTPLSLRARFALQRLSAHRDSVWSEGFLRSFVTDNQVYLADLVLDDVLALCQTLEDAKIRPTCDALAAWDRTAGVDAGPGYRYFEAFARAFAEADDLWRTPFDVEHPLDTPSGLAWTTPANSARLAGILEEVTQRLSDAQSPWGKVQGVTRGSSFIAIPGGDGKLGVYNAIQSRPGGNGQREVFGGSSYIQLVSFDEQGPVARGVLSFSQASEPSSPHASDQTQLFSRQQWPLMPFTPEQIQADPPVRKLRLRE
jgi:acyl-homoserine-lactone acylase